MTQSSKNAGLAVLPAATEPQNGSMAATDWSTAASFEDLCLLTAHFLGGTLGTFPGWLASYLDGETEELAPVLTALNLGGFLTVASQQGHPPTNEPDGHRRARRTFVMGFASPASAARLAGLASSTEGDLRLDVFSPTTAPDPGSTPCSETMPGDLQTSGRGEAETSVLPVGLLDGEPFLIAGHDAATRELEIFSEYCQAEAIAALARCSWISAVDLAWARRPLLWDTLRNALAPTN